MPKRHSAPRLHGIYKPLTRKTMKPFSDRRSFLQTAALAATTVAASGPLVSAWAQTKWPAKPIRIIVAFPPGGLTDALARSYGDHLATKLGVPVVIDNKPGAGAIIGIDAAAKAPADGYTLVMSTSGTFWQNRILYSKLPYNLDKDLTPVTVFPSGPLVVGINDKIPANNMSYEQAACMPVAVQTMHNALVGAGRALDRVDVDRLIKRLAHALVLERVLALDV